MKTKKKKEEDETKEDFLDSKIFNEQKYLDLKSLLVSNGFLIKFLFLRIQ